MTSSIVEYETWDLTPPKVPPRSRLYCLEPIGIGTPLVESLTSYVNRLAEAHNIPVKTLIAKEIAPFIDVSYVGSRTSVQVYNKFIRAINGFGVIATAWVKALEIQTKRGDLCFLTMLQWSNVITDRCLLRKTQAWCPQCYNDWYNSQKAIYFPLLWSLRAVTSCHLHHQKLRELCPSCDRTQLWLDKNRVLGFCPSCGTFLGNDTRNTTDDMQREPSEKETWVATSLGNLLAEAPALQFKPTRAKLATSFTTCIQQSANGQAFKLATLIAMKGELLRCWRSGRYIPQLNHLCTFCYSLKISLCDFLLNTPVTELRVISPKNASKKDADKKEIAQLLLRQALEEFPSQTIQELAEKIEVSPSWLIKNYSTECALLAALGKEHRSRMNAERWETYRQALTAIHGTNPMTVKDIAKSLGCDVSLLYYKFPQLCHSISGLYIEARTRTEQKVREAKIEKIKIIASNLIKEGCYPSEKKVKHLLGESCSWDIIRQALNNIGHSDITEKL